MLRLFIGIPTRRLCNPTVIYSTRRYGNAQWKIVGWVIDFWEIRGLLALAIVREEGFGRVLHAFSCLRKQIPFVRFLGCFCTNHSIIAFEFAIIVG